MTRIMKKKHHLISLNIKMICFYRVKIAKWRIRCAVTIPVLIMMSAQYFQVMKRYCCFYFPQSTEEWFYLKKLKDKSLYSITF